MKETNAKRPHILSIYMKYAELQIYRHRKDICNCLGMEWGGCWGKLGSDWTEFPFQWWNVLKLTVAMIGRACEYTKKQLSCILQLDELYLNNAIILKKDCIG